MAFFPYFVRKYLTIFSLRNIILLLFLFSAVYLGISLIYPWIWLKKIVLPLGAPVSVSSQYPSRPELPEQRKKKEEAEFYIQKIGNRRMFATLVREPQIQEASPVIPQGELLKDISLVGIVTAAPAQAIIEDRKTQKTYYVGKGQFIDEYKIEDIQEGKIILEHNGQKYELYM